MGAGARCSGLLVPGAAAASTGTAPTTGQWRSVGRVALGAGTTVRAGTEDGTTVKAGTEDGTTVKAGTGDETTGPPGVTEDARTARPGPASQRSPRTSRR